MSRIVISNVTKNENELEKTVRLRNEKKNNNNSGHNITICFNLLHVSPSVSPFLCAVFFIPYFNVLRSYFCVLLNLLAVPALLVLINCPHDTAFLNSVLFWTCSELHGAGAAEPHRTFFFPSWPKHWLSNFLILQPMKGPCRNVLLRFRKFANARETYKIFTCAKFPRTSAWKARYLQHRLHCNQKMLSFHTQHSGA